MESETRIIWRLLWNNGIEFKSKNPDHDADLIWFIRNDITKLYNKESELCSYVLYAGTDRQLVLK